MTKADIIKLAQEAGLTKGQHWNKQNMTTAFMCDFANLVAEQEREECAKVCEERGMVKGGEVFALRVRSRGTT